MSQYDCIGSGKDVLYMEMVFEHQQNTTKTETTVLYYKQCLHFVCYNHTLA